jgi:predicted DNA-binding transcriptional regulator AlpA
MTISEIAAMVGRSRQLVHRLATKDPEFPVGVVEPGSTRIRYPRGAVEAWWEQRKASLRQGRRTDLEKKREEGGADDR